MMVFQDYAYYYNAFYKDKDYQAEAAVVDKLLKQYNPQIRSIINFGCGTGQHDIELAGRGYQCKGIDMSQLMINIAIENAGRAGYDIAFDTADIREYEADEKFDAVISLFHVMSYQNSNADILKAFCTAKKMLKAGGIFLFDIWYGPGVLSDKPEVRVKEVEDMENRLIRIARPVIHEEKNVVDVNYEVLVINKATGIVRTIDEVHHMRYFFRPELEFLLAEAGFEILEHIDCQTLLKTDFNSWTSYLICRAW